MKTIILQISGFLIGLSKTGLPGAGTLAVPLTAMVIPARTSTGVILPMLIFGDILAVSWYRKTADWTALVRLLPWAAAGVVIGYFLMGTMNDEILRRVIGAVVLAMLGLSIFHQKKKEFLAHVPHHPLFAAVMGLLCGITTMLANAAGPIMILYLLAMGLKKEEFIGTGAWYFFLVNWFKVPFSAHLGFINAETLRLNMMTLPAIFVGGVAGIIFVKKIPEKSFTVIIQILTLVTAVKLLF